MELFEILKFVFNIQSANFNSSMWCSVASDVQIIFCFLEKKTDSDLLHFQQLQG